MLVLIMKKPIAGGKEGSHVCSGRHRDIADEARTSKNQLEHTARHDLGRLHHFGVGQTDSFTQICH